MWKNVAIAAAVGAAVAGVGVAALAETGSSGSTPSSAPASGTAPAKQHHPVGRLRPAARNFEHGSFVLDEKGASVTHDAIQGRVQGTPGDSVTVKATDGTQWSFTVTSATKVTERENGKGSAKSGVIGDVKPGDHVVVIGTEANGTRAAVHVLDLGTK